MGNPDPPTQLILDHTSFLRNYWENRCPSSHTSQIAMGVSSVWSLLARPMRTWKWSGTDMLRYIVAGRLLDFILPLTGKRRHRLKLKKEIFCRWVRFM
jgi:hypothetical protein